MKKAPLAVEKKMLEEELLMIQLGQKYLSEEEALSKYKKDLTQRF